MFVEFLDGLLFRLVMIGIAFVRPITRLTLLPLAHSFSLKQTVISELL
jgi:hypothetical protein